MNIQEQKTIKLLIVEDNPEDRFSYKRMLSQVNGVGWNILEADSGKDGLKMCQTENPDCVLLDYILPDTDGLEFMLQLKKLRVTCPVIMLTGQGDETVAVLAIKEGANNYLVKNLLTPASLKNSIIKCIQQNTLVDPAPEHAPKESGRADSNSSWNKKKKTDLISEIHQLTEKLESTSGIDPVTGLPNRKNMLEKLYYEKCRFERNKNSFSLIIADIDDFPNLHQTYGSETVKDLLKEIGHLLYINSRAQDVVGHWAKERFLLLLPETGMEGATILIEKLCQIVEKGQLPCPQQAIPITMSFRAGVYDDSTLKIEDCIEMADQCVL